MEIQEFLEQIGIDTKKHIELNWNGTVKIKSHNNEERKSRLWINELWRNKQSATN